MSIPSQRRLRIGALLSASESEGGAFTQSLNIAKTLAPRDGDPYTLEYIVIDKGDRKRLEEAGLPVAASLAGGDGLVRGRLIRLPALRSLLRSIYLRLFADNNRLDKLAQKNGYDLLLFTSASRLAMSVRQTPFVYTVWDLCHRDHPEFPEIAHDGSFAWREKLFSSVLPRASGYLVETEGAALRLAATYSLDPGKALILPYRISDELTRASSGPEDVAALRHKHGLHRPYIYYPAQFWAHKNHVYILQALRILKDRGVEIDAVFSGSDLGLRPMIERRLDALGVRDHVKMVGFLPVVEVAALYKGSVALVMPTYFGPTNIPPLEAEALGCPVIYSDLPGHREFLGPSALYCDLTRPDHLADLIMAAANGPRPAPLTRDWKEDAAREQFLALVSRLAAKISAWTE